MASKREVDNAGQREVRDSVFKDGETIGGSEKDVQGQVQTSFLPDEVDVESITPLQQSVVMECVRNPHLGTEAIGERIGKKGGYVRATLKRVCPDWYDTVFKPAGSEGGSDSPFLDTIASECDSCGHQVVLHTPVEGPPKARCNCTEFILRPVPESWQ